MSFKKLEVIVSTTIISIGSLLLSQTPTLEFMGQIVFSNPTGPQMCGLEAFAYMEQVFDGCSAATEGVCIGENTEYFENTDNMLMTMGGLTLDVDSFFCNEVPWGDHRTYLGGNIFLSLNGMDVLVLHDIVFTGDTDYLGSSFNGFGTAYIDEDLGDPILVDELNVTGSGRVDFWFTGTNAVVQGDCGFYDFIVTIEPVVCDQFDYEEDCVENSECFWDGMSCLPPDPYLVCPTYQDPESCEADERCEWDVNVELCIVDEGDDLLMGDINMDGNVDVIDVVEMVDIILFSAPDDYQLLVGDLDGNSTIDVNDIVLLVGIILSP